MTFEELKDAFEQGEITRGKAKTVHEYAVLTASDRRTVRRAAKAADLLVVSSPGREDDDRSTSVHDSRHGQ